MFQFFDNTLKDKKKLNLKFELHRRDNIPLISEIIEDDDDNSIVPVQQGQGLNYIKIDKNALNKNILKIRYLNGRKLNNQLLKMIIKFQKI